MLHASISENGLKPYSLPQVKEEVLDIAKLRVHRSYADIFMKIFGPVLSIGKFHTEQEAIDLANDTTYGLAAGLHSSNRPCFRLPSQAHNHLS